MNRLERVIAAMEAEGLKQFILSDPSSIDYLTGVAIDPGERLFALLIRTDGQHRFFINRLFPSPETEIAITSFSDTDDSIALIAAELDPALPVGIDKYWPAHFLLSLMEENAASAYRNASTCVDFVRAIKDDEEQALMREASLINDDAIEYAATQLRIGMTENELADIITDYYISRNSPGPSFTPIVAFGDHAADPHHVNSDRQLKVGDVVLMDIGCLYQGYCSDMTRTVLTAAPSEKLTTVYNLVRDANLAAEALIRPGVRLSDIDAAARDLITAGGYGAQFTHRLGHFIGREVHEYGDVSSQNDRTVEPGMIFSIEPGIYIPGEFGVRIEDLIIVTEEGCEVLNHVSKDIQVIAIN